MILILILTLPLAAAALCWLLHLDRLAPRVTVATALAVLALALYVASRMVAGGRIVAIENAIAVDGLSALILLLIAFVGTTAAVFSWGYMARMSHAPQRLRLYYANYNLFLFSMLAIPVLLEPTFVWIVVELTTLSSAMLVGFENTRTALEAAWKYVVLSLMGAAVALLGFLLLFSAMQAAGGGTYTWDGLVSVAPRMPPVLLQTAFLLVQVRDYKRMFAYSTVEHMGIILMAAGLGGAAGHYAAMNQILSHTLTKSFCFYAAGAALLATGSREIAAVHGLIRSAPAAGASLLLGGLAIAGAPPFAVFLSEFSIFKAGLAEGRYVAIGLLVLFIAIGFLGILSHVNRMVFGRPSADPPQPVRLPRSCTVTLIVAGLLVVALGLFMPEPLHALLRLAAGAYGG